MSIVTLTTGLPGSGKTTWAEEKARASKGRVVRINRDDLREMAGIDWREYDKDNEELIRKQQDVLITSAVASGRDVIVDGTHLYPKVPTRIKKLFDGDVLFVVKDFTHVPLEQCIANDAARSRSLGEQKIRKIAQRLNSPWRLTEEFMNDVTLSPRYAAKFGKPMAILVDLDGTLARHDHRSPYDYSLVITDGLIIPVARTVDMYAEAGYQVIYLSGRPDINNVRADTEKWLHTNYLPAGQLIMRPADMLTVNDADVKQHLFDKYVRDHYNVDVVLDDRNRVVRRWRKLGLKVYQVSDGDF